MRPDSDDSFDDDSSSSSMSEAKFEPNKFNIHGGSDKNFPKLFMTRVEYDADIAKTKITKEQVELFEVMVEF